MFNVVFLLALVDIYVYVCQYVPPKKKKKKKLTGVSEKMKKMKSKKEHDAQKRG